MARHSYKTALRAKGIKKIPPHHRLRSYRGNTDGKQVCGDTGLHFVDCPCGDCGDVVSREINPYAVAVRANELIDLKAKIERYCWGVADGSIKPESAADMILAMMIRETPSEVTP